ncbi:MAG: nucleotide-diphospho-sugar transferase [Bacteroidetes bacterium]|nr:nucleotide-diphospho-sugar transferase [Fibrella sp.]
MPFDIPVLFILFNRPDHARVVFEQIRTAKPARLFVAVDGPRAGRPDDQPRVDACVALLRRIDWPCELKTLIRTENLGCGQAVSSAITWFFEQVEMGIILEDDCVPAPDFFPYCRELLLRHQHNPSVMHIGGVNLQDGNWRGSGSYYFTRICHIWGWATWRRAWKLYDFSMKSFAQFKRENSIQTVLPAPEDQAYWMTAFQKAHDGQIDTWDYQWVYAVWTNRGLGALPNVNLIKNIGFDETATHTKTRDLRLGDWSTGELAEIVHPSFVLEDFAATEHSSKMFFRTKQGWEKKVDRMRLRLRYRTWNI